MPDLKFEDKDVEQLMKLKTAAEERIACLHKIIIHEEETIKKVRPILRKFCSHKWIHDNTFSMENHAEEERCEKCLLLKHPK